MPGIPLVQWKTLTPSERRSLEQFHIHLDPSLQVHCPEQDAVLGHLFDVNISCSTRVKSVEGIIAHLDNKDVSSSFELRADGFGVCASLSAGDGAHTLTVSLEAMTCYIGPVYERRETTVSFTVRNALFSVALGQQPVIVQQGRQTRIALSLTWRGQATILSGAISPLPPGLAFQEVPVMWEVVHVGGLGPQMQPSTMHSLQLDVLASPDALTGATQTQVIVREELSTAPWTEKLPITIKVVPHVHLSSMQATVQLQPGKPTTCTISVEPAGDYLTDVALDLQNLPAGVTAQQDKLLASDGGGLVTLNLFTPMTAMPEHCEVTLCMTARWRGTQQTVQASQKLWFDVLPLVEGIVLGGGGAKGAFHVGALQYLYEKGLRPEVIAGASVGSLNGAVLAEGPGALLKLVSNWGSMSVTDDMYKEEPWLGRLSLGVKRAMHTTIGDVVEHFVVGVFFPPLGIAKIVDAAGDINEFVDAVNQASRAKSLYNLEPIHLRLQAQLDDQARASSGIKLRIAVVELESGDLMFVDEQGTLWNDSGTQVHSGVSMADAVTASAAVPVAFAPVELAGGMHFVDGAVRDILPVRAAIDAGAQRVYAIACTPVTLGSVSSSTITTMEDIAKRVALDVMPQEIEDARRKLAEQASADIRFIRPAANVLVYDALMIDPGLIDITIAYGYMRAADATTTGITDNERAALEKLADTITQLRLQIWQTEFYVNGYDLPTFDRYGTSLVPVASAQDLPVLRGFKRQLKGLVQARQSKQGAMPQGIENWWLNWEKHNWDYYVPTPWVEFVARTGTIPAEPPP